jgi:hypothetical protein
VASPTSGGSDPCDKPDALHASSDDPRSDDPVSDVLSFATVGARKCEFQKTVPIFSVKR